jgi:anti-sigma regulatory factor (Ser/Thr protein kinase)
LEYDAPESVKGDEPKVRQILTNLLGNAVKFTNRGTVSVKVSADGEARNDITVFTISVEDTGIGISNEGKVKIFNSFTQADGTTKRKFGGSGLGLAITKRLVSYLKGDIEVDSTPGEGSVFTCTIPFTVSLEEIPEENTDNKKTFDFDLDVLVVEDNTINRVFAEKMLRKRGCRVDSAKDGIEAISKLKVKLYDVLFLDIQMPYMDGYETTKKIRNPSSGVVNPDDCQCIKK